MTDEGAGEQAAKYRTVSRSEQEGFRMRRIRKAFFAKPLSIYLAAALIAATAFAGPVEAMYMDSGPRPASDGHSASRTADAAAMQRTLESRVIQQALVDYGLSPEQALAKVSVLTDDQVHQFATRLGAVQAGGRGDGIDATTLIIILLLVILILILVENTEGQQSHLA